MKVVSFSLWGSNPKYCVGAVKNAELLSKVYPGWEGWFYCGTDVPQHIIRQLEELNARIIMVNEPNDWAASLWRFKAISDSKVDVMISRDADSRINKREAEAVEEWMQSNKMFHIMRDHPAHAIEIMAGMWGVKAPLLRNMNKLIDDYTRMGDFWQVDQNFLKEIVYPIVKDHSMVHDPFFERKPFPSSRNDYEFVGDVFDHEDRRHPEYWKDIKKTGIK
jgi:hypothetical protein